MCGLEVNQRFPGLSMRTLTRAPGVNDCVIYRGDDARLIADDLVVDGNQ